MTAEIFKAYRQKIQKERGQDLVGKWEAAANRRLGQNTKGQILNEELEKTALAPATITHRAYPANTSSRLNNQFARVIETAVPRPTTEYPQSSTEDAAWFLGIAAFVTTAAAATMILYALKDSDRNVQAPPAITSNTEENGLQKFVSENIWGIPDLDSP